MLTGYQRVKVKGAIEAIQLLLDHCRAHTIPIDEKVVETFLEQTQKVLKE